MPLPAAALAGVFARGRFILPASHGRRERAVGGLRVRVDSTPEIQHLKRTIPGRFRRAFRARLKQGRR